MALFRGLVGMVCIAIVSSQYNRISGQCDSAENALYESRFESALGQLPRDFVATNTGSIQLIPNIFFLGNTTVQGLIHMRMDRPHRSFCRGDDHVTLFSIRSTRPIRISIPWRFCGHTGTINAHAVHLRYEGEMITNKASGVSRIDGLTPVLTENFFVGLQGAGQVVDTVVSVLAHILYGPVRLYWVEVMTANVNDALSDALQNLV